jgi:predicted ATPase
MSLASQLDKAGVPPAKVSIPIPIAAGMRDMYDELNKDRKPYKIQPKMEEYKGWDSYSLIMDISQGFDYLRFALLSDKFSEKKEEFKSCINDLNDLVCILERKIYNGELYGNEADESDEEAEFTQEDQDEQRPC